MLVVAPVTVEINRAVQSPWNTVHPPPAVVLSQNTSKAVMLSGLMVYVPSVDLPADLWISAQFLKAMKTRSKFGCYFIFRFYSTS